MRASRFPRVSPVFLVLAFYALRLIARGVMSSKMLVLLFGLPPMDCDLPCDVDSAIRRSWPFPSSCSPGSVSVADDCEEVSPGRKFPSTGTIPILLFDDDVGDHLLESDLAAPSPPFGITANNNTTGRRVVQDRSSAILGLGIAGSCRERSGAGDVEGSRNGFKCCSHRARRVDGVDGDRAGSGTGEWEKEDKRGQDLSLVLNAESCSSPCSRCCSCRPSCSRSSSLSRSSQASAPLISGSQSMQRTCHGSCCASPAAITNAPVIAAAKHDQNFALEVLLICQPSSNSFALYDSLEQLHPPLTSNHDQRQHPRAVSSPSPFSSPEADLSIDSPPRDPTMMDHRLPPSYSPSIEPSSSSSSSSNSSLPRHLAWIQDTTISLCIDQESFRTVFPAFKLVGYTNLMLPIHPSPAGMQNPFAGRNDGNPWGSPTRRAQHSDHVDQASMDPDSAGMAEFMPVKRESFLFHHSTLDPPPSIRRLSVDGDESRDYLSQYAYLGIKSSGGFQVYVVRGSETRRGASGDGEVMMTTGRSARARGSPGTVKLDWRFEYAVEDKRKADGTKAGDGEKFLTPLRFSCSPELLHPRQGRKVTVLSVWKKSIQPRVIANRLEPLTIPSPTTPGNQTHALPSPTSPKSLGVGGLLFPSASRLWGKRTKNSPYPFDKGSDGSEEELIPSEGSANRRRRRPTSVYVPSRVSLEAEWPLRMWDRDRGRSADAVWQASRDARPATAGGAEGSTRGRIRAQSFGRGAASEGENESVSSRSRGGRSTTRYGQNRRPRTAR